MGKLLPDILAQAPHLQAFDDLFAQRMADMDLSAMMPYMIDTCPAIMLPYLAETFNVLGYRGWRFADTEAKQRALLKKSIELHRHAGTPWAIKEALKAINILNCTIIEGYNIFYDNTIFYDGQFPYGGGSWADFRVQVAASNFSIIDPSLINDITGIVNEWKNARSHLIDISFSSDDVDTMAPTDVVVMTVEHPANHSLDFSVTF